MGSMEKVGKDLVNSWIKQGHTYEWISTELKKCFLRTIEDFQPEVFVVSVLMRV